MAIKFQYNKTSLTNMDRQLKVRQNALPTLKNKESALRVCAMVAKAEEIELEMKLEGRIAEYDYLSSLWNEFDTDLISISSIETHLEKVAGVKVPFVDKINYELKPFNAFTKPAWYADGIEILKDITFLEIKLDLYRERRAILDFNRKKTTQKVNLYEKVQIPGFQEAVRKIKRFMEDEENLSKAASKIVKLRHEEDEAL